MSCGGSKAPRCLSVRPDSADSPNGHTVLLAREERARSQLLRDRAESPEGGTCSPRMGLQPAPSVSVTRWLSVLLPLSPGLPSSLLFPTCPRVLSFHAKMLVFLVVGL